MYITELARKCHHIFVTSAIGFNTQQKFMLGNQILTESNFSVIRRPLLDMSTCLRRKGSVDRYVYKKVFQRLILLFF
jgi:hypothetical protein